MHSIRRGVLAALFLSLALAPPAAADVITLTSTQDNTILSENGALSNGGGIHFYVGQTDMGATRRGLVRFDVAGSVPAGSTITEVTLGLYMSRAQADNAARNVRVHRVLTAWGEAGSDGTGNGGGGEAAGGAALTGDATWTFAQSSTVSWTNPGGDFVATASATASVGVTLSGTAGRYTWTSANLVSDVQGWLDTPSSDRGWILILDASGDRQTRQFDSHENTNVARRPELVITYTPPPTGACCSPDGSCQTVFDPGGDCTGDYHGSGTTCAPNPCPPPVTPTGACCAADGSCSVVEDPGGSCTGGVYQGADTSCSPNLCPQPTGACCLPTASATCSLLTESECSAQVGLYRGDGSPCDATANCPIVLEPFVDPLPLPKTATPLTGAAGGEAAYRLATVQLTQKLHRDLPATTVWGYDDGTGGTYPGPTIEAAPNAPISVTWANDLRDQSGDLLTEHYLDVDTCPHGADDPSPRVVTHFHGGHVESRYDGYPELTILPGEEDTYQYPNWQDAATLWYHDHALGITRLNVYMGLAGFYLIRSAEEQALGLPSGDYDVPLAVQDRAFNPDGSLKYPSEWMGHVFGEVVLVNGKAWPYLNVKQGKYRFRILNGSGSRTYNFKMSNGAPLYVIGSDGGLLKSPLQLSELRLSPGERADVIVDFSLYGAGTEIVLENDAPMHFPGTPGDGVIPNIMKFVVQGEAGHTSPLPLNLRTIDALPTDDVAQERDFVLDMLPDPCGGGNAWFINGLGWHDITERPVLGTTEIWRFINDTGVMHPMHMHLVFFQVLDRTPFQMVSGVPTATGDPMPPSGHEAGWKDTVQVMPGEMVRVIARFEDFTGKFAYHCHILEHEDHEMMRQFETVTECGDGARGLPEEECDEGGETATCNSDCTFAECGDGVVNPRASEECDDENTTDGDGCSADCAFEDEDMMEEPGEDGGCGCQSSSGAGGLGLLLTALWMGFRRRRR